MDRVKLRFIYLGVCILVTVLTGTLGFHLIEDYTLFDAFYMVMITITTVGYREVQELSQAGRVFNSLLILFGVTTIFFAIGVMTQTIVELQLGELFGKQRVKRMIENLEQHFIVCGLGRVGQRASDELKEANVPFVVIDCNEDRVEQAIRKGMLALAADSTLNQSLMAVGVTKAKGLISALTTDADNLFVILSAKGLNPNLRIAARVAEEEAIDKMRQAGADIISAPYVDAGHQLAQALLKPHVTEFLDTTTKSIGLDVALEELQVYETSQFVSKSLAQLDIRSDLGVIVLAIRKADGQMLFNPPAEAIISGGDYLIVMGENQNLRKLESHVRAVDLEMKT